MNNTLFDEQTFYEILEVKSSASPHEIRLAYQRAKETYSPDSPALYTMFTPGEARQLLKLIEEAYSVLSNQSRRKEYDLQLANTAADQAREDLPDFPSPEDAEDSIDLTKKSSGSAPVKGEAESFGEGTGSGRTRFSSYEIDEDFEQEIQNAQEFDGPFLGRIRNYKNVSLNKISDETRVSRTYLRALENDDYSALPAPVFVRGFVTQVAKILGLDEKSVVDSYMKRMKKNQP